LAIPAGSVFRSVFVFVGFPTVRFRNFARPILHQRVNATEPEFRKWLDEQAPQVLPESLLGKAISYTRNQWTYLSRYVSDGHAPVDNNVIERDIRPFCTGRSSWLFSDTVAGAKASAIVYSLMLTCRACNVEPYAYLVHVLTELPQRAPDADVTDLLPFNFAKLTAAARKPA
jgi:hypothetical protein